MLAFALGLAWLVLGPLCLWFVIRGRTPLRIGAVMALALLETGTVWFTDHQDLEPVAAVASHVVPQAPAVCQESIPVPSGARVASHHDSLTLTWTAGPRECDTAKVVVHHKGSKLKVWIHEGPLRGRHVGVQTVPVHVSHGTATLRLPLDLPDRPRYHPVDGRTGHRIPRLS